MVTKLRGEILPIIAEVAKAMALSLNEGGVDCSKGSLSSELILEAKSKIFDIYLKWSDELVIDKCVPLHLKKIRIDAYNEIMQHMEFLADAAVLIEDYYEILGMTPEALI